jgi:hypothetical protein
LALNRYYMTELFLMDEHVDSLLCLKLVSSLVL